jgi:hypothetical protein
MRKARAMRIEAKLPGNLWPEFSDTNQATWMVMVNTYRNPGFLDAAQQEIKELTEKETFKHVKRPQGAQVIPLKWVFNYKFDTDNRFSCQIQISTLRPWRPSTPFVTGHLCGDSDGKSIQNHDGTDSCFRSRD